MEIILGSQSPRRKEILSFFSLPFKQISPDFDESLVPFEGDAAQYVCEVAKKKALSLTRKYPKTPILTADTTVSLRDRIFMKPENLAEAHTMLKELAGKEHTVYTGVCVALGGEHFVEAEASGVEFFPLTDKQIHLYHSQVSPLDKAGAYAIQKSGSLIVKRIKGCYYNIMGLPLHTTHRLLLKFGIDLWDFLKPV